MNTTKHYRTSKTLGDGNTLKLAQGYQIGTNGNFNRDYAEYGDTFAYKHYR